MSGEDAGKNRQEALEAIKEQRWIIEALKRDIAKHKWQLEARRACISHCQCGAPAADLSRFVD